MATFRMVYATEKEFCIMIKKSAVPAMMVSGLKIKDTVKELNGTKMTV